MKQFRLRKVCAVFIVLFWTMPAQAKILILQYTPSYTGDNWQLIASSPQANESLEKPPQTIKLTFSGTVKPGTGSLILHDPYGYTVETAEATYDGTSMSFALNPFKPGYQGIYRAEWKAQCQCNAQSLSSSFYFNIH
jgi:methionine-rich copper-binding protein CopC